MNRDCEANSRNLPRTVTRASPLPAFADTVFRLPADQDRGSLGGCEAILRGVARGGRGAVEEWGGGGVVMTSFSLVLALESGMFQFELDLGGGCGQGGSP